MFPASAHRVVNYAGRRSITPTLIRNYISAYDPGAISDGQKATPGHRRKPARGGQNLTDRYKRLENSLRHKRAISEEISDFAESNPSVPSSRGGNASGNRNKKLVQMFRGFEVPEEPKPPADDECCMSGCAVCVYDLYEESMEAYRDALSKLKTSLSALNIPETEWPATIRPKDLNTQTNSKAAEQEIRKSTVLSAFEEMERALALKKQQQQAATLPAVGGSSSS
ncbi:hypothetical protein CPC08DRAFT_638827 [Agrocybe pediades]|nr:hypothetical protein CPC08DRAFT_638827 [Agrocybe pediades]